MTETERIGLWKDLYLKGFSLIPLNGKRPIEQDWSQWCTKQRPFKPDDFRGHNAGIACGPASGIVVADVDDPELFKDVLEDNGALPDTLTHETGKGGLHYVFQYPNGGGEYGNRSFKDPTDPKKTIWDIRGLGGQVVAPGSIHPDTGKPYRVLRDLPMAPCPEWIADRARRDPETNTSTSHAGAAHWTGQIDELPISRKSKDLILQGVPKGERSEAIMSVLNALAGAELSDPAIYEIFERYAIGEKFRGQGRTRRKWLAPQIAKARQYAAEHVITHSSNKTICMENASTRQNGQNSGNDSSDGNHGKKVDRGKQNEHAVKCRQWLSNAVNLLSNAVKEEREKYDVTQQGIDFISDLAESYTPTKTGPRQITQELREWVLTADGVFLTADVGKELGLTARDGMKQLTKALCRLKDEGIIERVGDKRGQYRRVNQECDGIDWRNAPTESYSIRWPFQIERMVDLHPGNIVVVAGEPNAGKTAFLLNVVKLNMNQGRDIHYFSSEMGAIEMKKRLAKFQDVPLIDWGFKAWERSSDFADVIRPDGLNIIDYLEVHDNFYVVGGMLKAIHDRLNNGIAVVALQKNRGVDFGLGGARGLEKPRLYLAMSPRELKIVKAKNWTTSRNPNGLTIEFKLVNGAVFVPTSEWNHERKDHERSNTNNR